MNMNKRADNSHDTGVNNTDDVTKAKDNEDNEGNVEGHVDANADSNSQEVICICCPLGCLMQVTRRAVDSNADAISITTASNNATTASIADEFVVTGNKCARGKKYARTEMLAPVRVVTSTVKIMGAMYPVIPVKTAAPVPKDKIFAIMDILSDVEVHAPLHVGDVVVENIVASGVNVVATKTMERKRK